ncbi:MAG: flagellar hook-basal body complex protein FliE [Burkholderiales bacterium]|nr:flagellar hook-basal body complex protein FliE [Burkholderiales bacterium]
MSIEAISFLPADSLPSLVPAGGAAPAAGATAGGFGTWFGEQLNDLNTKLAEADRGVQRLAAGDASNLHQVMINLEEAKMSMQLVMQVRNHLLDAYHDIAQMQL